MVAPANGISRRQMVRRTAAVTAAVSATPLVTSIVTPAHAITAQGHCPGSRCASDSSGGKGDDYCGCSNACTEGDLEPNCDDYSDDVGQFGSKPFYGSCECEQCPHTSDYDDPGGFDWDFDEGIRLCELEYGTKYWLNNPTDTDEEANWDEDWPENCTATQVAAPRQYGCDKTENKVDGVCACDPGGSSSNDCNCEADV
jgi:hypothetical protein